jgi:hypothetical protein
MGTMIDNEDPTLDQPAATDENETADQQEPTIDPNTPLEAQNLVAGLNANDDEKAWLDEQAKHAVKRYEVHNDERKEFMERRANQIKQYAGVMPPLRFPAEGDKAPHHPLLLQAALSLWARIWDQVCPAKGDIVHIAVVGEPDEERQMTVEKHMNWQLRTKMPEWVTSHGESIMQFVLGGSTFREYVWDPIDKCNRIDHVTCEDMVISYAEKDPHPLMPSVPCVTRVMRLPKHVIKQYQDIEFFDPETIDEIYDASSGGQPSSSGANYIDGGPVKDAANKVDGVNRPDGGALKDPDPVRVLIRQHLWLELPQLGYKPVTLVVDWKTKKAVRLTLRETPDPLDQQRFDLETQAFTAKQASLQAAFAAPPQVPPLPGPALVGEGAGSGGVADAAPAPSAPQIPPGMLGPEPKPVRKKPVYTVVHYRLFPNPEGFYGIGAGYLLENSNALIDEILSDVLIAGRLANTPQGFISDQMNGIKGDVQMVPGKFHPLPVQPEQLKDAIHQFQFNAPPPIMMEIAKLLIDEAKGQTANQEVLSGEKGTSHETAKSMQIRNSNAMTVVNVMTRLYIEPLKYEIKLIAHGNSIYMDPVEWFSVVEPSKTQPGQQDPKAMQISREMYLEDYHITFTADSRMTSQPERVQDAFNLANQIQQSQIVKDPQRGPALLWLAQKKIFHALELPEFEAALGQPPQPAPPPQPQSQVDENAGFLKEHDHPVLPDDNHLEHLGLIQQFRTTPYFEKATSTAKQLLDRHEQAHMSEHYKQTMGMMNGQAPAGMVPGGGGPGGLPPRPAGGPLRSVPGPASGGPGSPGAGGGGNVRPPNGPSGGGLPPGAANGTPRA